MSQVQMKKLKASVSHLPVRASNNRFYACCYHVISHWTFITFISIVIIVNTVILALDKYPEDPETTRITNLLNDAFTWVFVVEMIIKMIGLGLKEYARDSFNLFDAFIVVVSFIDMIVLSTVGVEHEKITLTAFRSIRLLRIFKLVRYWSSFRKILQKTLLTIKDVSTFSILLLMFMFIFSLLGMELYGYKAFFYNDLGYT